MGKVCTLGKSGDDLAVASARLRRKRKCDKVVTGSGVGKGSVIGWSQKRKGKWVR